MPSGVRLVPAPPSPRPPLGGEEVVGPGGDSGDEDGLPLGDKGKLPWREYARGGQGLGAKGAVKKRAGRKG